jgi:hypothetical protein
MRLLDSSRDAPPNGCRKLYRGVKSSARRIEWVPKLLRQNIYKI